MKESIKSMILGFKLLYIANRALKRFLVKSHYNKTVGKYRAISNTPNLKVLLNKNGFTEEWAQRFINRKCRLIFVGTDEKQDKGGFVQSLMEFFDVVFFYDADGNWGHKRGGAHKEENAKILLEMLQTEKLADKPIDIILLQAMGKSFNCADIEKIKQEYDVKIVNIGMDERLAYTLPTPREESQNYGISGLNRCVDLCLTTCPEVVEWYLKENVPAIYFPLASSETFYYPIHGIKKQFDVGFIGSKYGSRIEIVNYLIANGINVQCYGPGWENGSIDVEKNNEFYNKCRVVLGFGGIGYCEDFTNPKLRDYEVPLSGVLYATTYTGELHEFYGDDKGIILYKDRKELLFKLNRILSDEKIRKEIESESYKIACRNHTYDIRFEALNKAILSSKLDSSIFIEHM